MNKQETEPEKNINEENSSQIQAEKSERTAEIENKDPVARDENATTEETNPNDDLSDIEMVKCPRCGKDTPKSVRLCIFCGYNLVDKPYIGISKKKARIIKWAIGIPLLIAFFIWFLMTR